MAAPGERDAAPNPTTLRFARRAAGVVGLQIVAIVAAIVFYAVETAQGLTDDNVRAVMSMVTMAIFVAGLGLLARGLWRASTWATTPTLVWNGLLLPVAVEFLRGGELRFGMPILLVALAAIVFVVASVRSRPGGFAGA